MIRLATFAAATLLMGCPASAQDSIADFYRGKTVTLQIGSEPGGGYDLVGRAVARHIGKHIPGNPTVIVQNVPGGGSLRLANQIFNTGAKDGTLFALASNGMPTTPLLIPSAAHFNPLQFNWLGSTSRETEIMVVWHKAPVKKLDDVFTTEMIVGASAPGSATWDFPFVLNQLLGTKFKIVTGYRGATQIKLAMQRGEVHSNVALAWGSARTQYADVLRTKELIVMGKYSETPDPALAKVPIMRKGKTAEDRQILDILYSRESYGRPFFTPPGVPADRVAALRRAFAATMKDTDFQKDAAKRRIEVEPVTGDQLAALTRNLMEIPPGVVARARKLLSPKGAKERAK
ncbi:MAG: Bug family tripartite tricarboxylate transporter substrate binding protein [Xanthobacteraceae bacterium]